jgi:hypothetical protein
MKYLKEESKTEGENEMACEQRGIGRWFGTLTQRSYDSEMACRHYEGLEARRRAAATPTKAEQWLEKLSPAELKNVIETLSTQAAETSNAADMGNSLFTFNANHPELVTEGWQGTVNGAAIRTYLVQRGAYAPYSVSQLEEAYSALVDTGALHIDKAKTPGSPDFEAQADAEIRRRTSRDDW